MTVCQPHSIRLRPLLCWLLLLLLSASLHLADLGSRSFHHDEAIHAHAAFQLLHQGSYRYNPTYHGPLLYYLTAGSFVIFGDSDFTARLPIAVAGMLLVWVAWLLRRPLGERAAWWTGLLVTISPITLYYGRFLRMDVLELLCASAAAALAWQAVRRPERWIWAGIWAALAVATKENAYVTAALVALVWGLMAGTAALRRTWSVAFPPATSPPGAGAAEPEQPDSSPGPRQPSRLVGAGRWLVLAVTETLASLGRWLLHHRWGLLMASAAAFLLLVPLYTVGFRYPEDWLFPLSAIRYWWEQHSIQRVAGPPWFHLPRLAQYELLPIVAALVWVGRRRSRLRPFETALILFAVSSVLMYCYLGEKVPWLGVHQVWAFLPLAGAQLARTFGRHGRWWSRSLAVLGLAATAVSAVVASFVVDEISPNLPRTESIVFVQTSPELQPVIREGRALAQGGEEPVAAVGSEAAWPLTWYWRRLPIWWAAPKPGLQPPLVICDPGDEQEIRRTIGPAYSSEEIPLRSWWVPGRAPTLSELLRYLLTRRPWERIGSTNVVVLRRLQTTVKTARDVPVPTPLAQHLGARRALMLGEGRLVEPRGLAVQRGRLAVADTGLSQVVLLDQEGTVLPLGLDQQPQISTFNQPEDVAWTADGDLLVADTWRHRLVRILGAGRSGASLQVLPVPDGGWYGPRSVAVAADGRLAVADTGNKRLVLYAANGQVESLLGSPGSAPGELMEPGGVAWLDHRHLLVCDTGNHRLQMLDTGQGTSRVRPLAESWSEIYARPQVVVLAPGVWLASDTPAAGLWLVTPQRTLRIELAGLLRPTGLAWEPPMLYLGDLQGRIWQLELDLGQLPAH